MAVVLRSLGGAVLQKRYSPLRSSLILAVIWAFWHWPLFWFEYQVGPLGMVFYLLLDVTPLAILFTAVFNRTGGSLPIAILLHASINITPIFVLESSLATNLWKLLILGMAFWMWRSPQMISYRQVENKSETATGLTLKSSANRPAAHVS
jgi:membrane protease YdiL (CAAX protease family)